jgi:hypothetical protein
MRAETLNRVALQIYRDIGSTSSASLLQKLVAALDGQASNPSDEAEQNVCAARRALNESLQGSTFNAASPIDQETLATLDVQGLLGNSLLARINDAFVSNVGTPSITRSQVEELRKQVSELYQEADRITDAFQYFDISADDLDPGEFEVMVAIPGQAIDCELSQFSKEVAKINQIMGVFTELSTGSRAPIKIKALSSSNLTLYLAALPTAAAMISVAIERVLGLYEKILNKLHKDLNSLNVPDILLSPIKEYIDKQVTVGLEEIARKIEKSPLTKIDASRRQEIKTDLRNSLRQIAQRIDRGFAFDVRGADAEPLNEGESKDPGKAASSRAIAASYRIVQESRLKLRQFPPTDEPTLGLPEPSID